MAKVTVDTCSHCRGLWLDAGELEKIVARQLHGVPLDRGGKESEPVWVQLLDGASNHLPDVLELVITAIVEGLLDGV